MTTLTGMKTQSKIIRSDLSHSTKGRMAKKCHFLWISGSSFTLQNQRKFGIQQCTYSVLFPVKLHFAQRKTAGKWWFWSLIFSASCTKTFASNRQIWHVQMYPRYTVSLQISDSLSPKLWIYRNIDKILIFFRSPVFNPLYRPWPNVAHFSEHMAHDTKFQAKYIWIAAILTKLWNLWLLYPTPCTDQGKIWHANVDLGLHIHIKVVLVYQGSTYATFTWSSSSSNRVRHYAEATWLRHVKQSKLWTRLLPVNVPHH